MDYGSIKNINPSEISILMIFHMIVFEKSSVVIIIFWHEK